MTNLLSLESFRQQLHYNPFHFFGWANDKVPVNSQCNTVCKEYAWQAAQALGRAEIRQAIEQAEGRLRDYLGFSLAPHFITDEVENYPRFYDTRLSAASPMDAAGGWKPVTLREGFVQAVGVEKLTLIATAPYVQNAGSPHFPFTDATPAPPYLVYRDADGDGLADTFEVGVTTAVTDPLQLAVYFATGDRLTSEMERWHIGPVQVVIAGGVATLKGRSWMLSRPVLYEGVAASDLDPSTVANYAQSLEVYSRVCDSTGTTVDTAQGKFIWETLPVLGWWGLCGGGLDGSTDPASQAYAIARVGIRSAELGIVTPGGAIYDAGTGKWSMTVPPWTGLFRPPDRVLVRYLAGHPLDEAGQIPMRLQTVIARMAMAEMTNRISACDDSNRTLYAWQTDRSRTANATEEYRISNRDLDNPYGLKAGHIYAWKETRQMRLIRGVTTN